MSLVQALESSSLEYTVIELWTPAWTSGHLGHWASGPLDLWASAPLDLRKPEALVLWGTSAPEPKGSIMYQGLKYVSRAQASMMYQGLKYVSRAVKVSSMYQGPKYRKDL